MNELIQLPRSALTDDLWRNPNLARLFAYLLTRVDENGTVEISLRNLARILDMTYASVRTTIEKLIVSSLISVESTKTVSVIRLNIKFSNKPKCDKSAEIKIFNNPQYGDIRRFVTEKRTSISQGVVYAIQFGHFVKIGCSSNPAERFLSLRNQYQNQLRATVKRMAITPPCSNYKTLECLTHIKYDVGRIVGTELFMVDFDNVVRLLQTLPYKTAQT